MKKLLLMSAFVVGPILYAQQKPISANELKKSEVLKTEQSTTTQATKGTQSTQAKSLNLSDTKAVKNKKPSTKTTDSKSRTVKKVGNAEGFNNKIEK